jgi:hypothetical protein
MQKTSFNPDEIGSLKEILLIMKDQAQIPYEIVWTGSDNSKIALHLIESSLAIKSDYVLNKVIGNYSYSGTPSSLVLDLQKRGFNIGTVVEGRVPNLPEDYQTKIKIDAKNLTIREILYMGLIDVEYASPVFSAVTDESKMYTCVSFDKAKIEYNPSLIF